MKCILNIERSEITIRDYSMVEDEGLGNLAYSDIAPTLSLRYEDDPEKDGKHIIIISGEQDALIAFLDFTEIPVRIVAKKKI